MCEYLGQRLTPATRERLNLACQTASSFSHPLGKCIHAVCIAAFCWTAAVLQMPLTASEVSAGGSVNIHGVDINGKPVCFGQDATSKGVVAVFLATQCPISNGYIPTLNSLAATYRRSGIEFCGIISDPGVTRSEALEHRAAYRIQFPILFDGSGELRRNLEPTHTPQAFVLDRQGQKLYSGAIDDLYFKLGRKKEVASKLYLDDAIKAVLAGGAVQVRSTTPIGCLLEEAPDKSKTSGVTFSRDIAPIIQANCVTCHQPGQSAPFSLLSYADVSKHAKQIVKVTQSHFMPPWKPTPDFGHFLDERRLSDYELSLLTTWTSTGKAPGDQADLPMGLTEHGGWRLGEPDVVLKMRETFHVPASGPDIRRYFVIPTRLTENRLLTAIDFHPGSPQAVHHASFYIDTMGAGRKLDELDPQPGYAGFGGPGFPAYGTLRSWFPGMSPRHLPRGMGRLVPRGSDLIAEVHYVCSGKEEVDRSSIGLYFGPRSAKQLVEEIQVGNKRINLPAGAKHHHEQASFTVPVDTIVLDVAPHMHVLGREMKVAATRPDGIVVPLVWVQDWDFNWQSQYSYQEPIRLPAGTHIDVDAWYDNSADNPLNPNSPPKQVIWGENSTDEMLICHFQCTCETMGELRQLMKSYHDYFADAQVAPRDENATSADKRLPAVKKPRPFR